MFASSERGKETTMSMQHVKGEWNETKGKLKEEVGHQTGSRKTERNGIFDQVKGKIQKGVGDLKDNMKEKVDSFLNRPEKKQ
jgi:uncharacterized protein YjbJ (UPF0337 family)